MDRRSLIASGIIVTGLGLATGRSAFAQDPNAEQINPNPETGAQHPPSDDYRGPPDADRDRSGVRRRREPEPERQGFRRIFAP